MTNISLPNDYDLISFDEIGSTNDEAATHARDGAAEGTVIWAKQQSAGRGRRGNTWVSKTGNLYTSIILRPNVPADEAGQLSLVTAVALFRTLRDMGVEARLKWPNDVLVNGMKLAGILLESEISGDGTLDWVVLGIGVNVLNAPEDTNAVAIAQLTDQEISVAEVLSHLCGDLHQCYHQWLNEGFAPIRDEWLQSAYGIGQELTARLPQENLVGTFETLDEAGALVLTLSGGEQGGSPQVKSFLDRDMLLAIDAGNSNIVFGLFDAHGRKLGSWRCVTESHRTANEYAFWLSDNCEEIGKSIKDIKGVSMASVVPDITPNLLELCENQLSCPPIDISAQSTRHGLSIMLENPAEAGADRIANAVAAINLYKSPLIVVDFGTATTFDVICGESQYLGGVIAPGINLSKQALHEAAAQLPDVEIAKPGSVIGKNTIHAMQSGLYWGYVSMVEGMARRIAEEYGDNMNVIATGGMAPLIAKSTDIFDDVNPDLTLQGLRFVYDLNTVAA